MKILIADDHAVVRQGYKSLLETVFQPCGVIEAENGADAVSLYRSEEPDVVVLDINMPGMSGIDACKQIVEQDGEAKVICFSMYEEVAIADRALQAGALGYITKSCPPGTLVDALNVVAAGKPFIQSELATKMAVRNTGSSRDPIREMTAREHEIFILLAKGKTTAEIAEHMSISSKTVSNYTAILKGKLNVATTAELVHLAADAGLINLGQE